MDEAYAWKNELLRDHIQSMLTLWARYFRTVYLTPIARVLELRSEDAEHLVRQAIILHDAGKLYTMYQRALKEEAPELSKYRREYRHELVSSYYYLHCRMQHSVLQEIDYCVAASLALHHEPILMGQLSRMGEPYLTVTEVIRRLKSTSIDDELPMHEGGVKLLEDLLRLHVGLHVQLPRKLKVEEVVDSLRSLMLTLSIKGSAEYRSRMRIKTAALASLLCVIDSWAAHEHRSSSEDDGGTFLARHARLAEVALAWPA